MRKFAGGPRFQICQRIIFYHKKHKNDEKKVNELMLELLMIYFSNIRTTSDDMKN